MKKLTLSLLLTALFPLPQTFAQEPSFQITQQPTLTTEDFINQLVNLVKEQKTKEAQTLRFNICLYQSKGFCWCF